MLHNFQYANSQNEDNILPKTYKLYLNLVNMAPPLVKTIIIR